jgi:hypothetical protein
VVVKTDGFQVVASGEKVAQLSELFKDYSHWDRGSKVFDCGAFICNEGKHAVRLPKRGYEERLTDTATILNLDDSRTVRLQFSASKGDKAISVVDFECVGGKLQFLVDHLRGDQNLDRHSYEVVDDGNHVLHRLPDLIDHPDKFPFWNPERGQVLVARPNSSDWSISSFPTIKLVDYSKARTLDTSLAFPQVVLR